MKVLFHANIPSPYRVEFFNALAEKVDLTVVYERRSASDRETEWVAEDNKKYKVYYLKGISYSGDASFSPGITSFLKKDKYDVFVISGYASLSQMLAIAVLKIRRIPYILNVDGGIIKEESDLKFWFKRKLVSGAECYLSTGKACDEFLTHYGAPKNKIKRYPFTSIGEKDILVRPLTESEKKSYKQNIQCDYSKMILSVGRTIHLKGFDILLEATNRLKADLKDDLDFGVYIVGGNPDDECLHLMNKYNLENVHFVPFMRTEKLADYYKAADLFVFPTRGDVWGLVLNEAMSYGLPIISSDRGNGGLELIRDNGKLFRSGDPLSLEKRICETLNSDKVNYMSRKSLEIIKEYTFENMVQRHIDIFRSFIVSNERAEK